MSQPPGHEYLASHQISGEVLRLAVVAESAAVLDAAAAAGVGHAARTLVKNGPLRVVLLGLKSGSALQEHETAGPLTLHVLSGAVDVTSPGRSDSLKAGDALVFGSSVAHSLQARADSVVLMTIAWPE